MNTSLEKLQNDFLLKGFSGKTRTIYFKEVTKYLNHFKRPPEELGTDEIREYLYNVLTEKQRSTSTVSQVYSALKFYYVTTLGREWESGKIPRIKKIKRLPVILDVSEIDSLLKVTVNLKHRTILAVIYSAGLRVSEASGLKLTDIDSKRMQIRIEQSKGAKDRYTILSQNVLELLREYWKHYHPHYWLFPGHIPDAAISVRTIQHIFERSRKKAGIKKHVSVHSLRHSFATHLLENGTGIHHIQLLLGHRSPVTTTMYLHVTRKDLVNIKSPIEQIL